jgi:1-deoxy-D-xylulose-5-phosphate synthase
VAIQNLPVVFAMDRAGLVGNDGPTHMGLYDIAYMLAVPNMIVTAPKDGEEMLALLRLGVEQMHGPFCLRYPRDNVPAPVRALSEIPAIEMGTWEVLRRGRDVALLATGTMVYPALEAARALEADGINATVVNCRFIKPIDESTLRDVLDEHDVIVTIEEGTIVNGFGASLSRYAEDARRARPALRFEILGVPDSIIDHANRDQQLADAGLDAAGIAGRVRAVTPRTSKSRVRESA